MSEPKPTAPSSVPSRRAFLAQTGRVVALAMVATAARRLSAQTAGDAGAASAAQGVTGGSGAQSAASNVEMTADAYKPVRRPPKPGATPTMNKDAVDTFERTLACPCPCTLDVYTCRTTDFNCGISPAVHADVQALVDGGYGADEIMTALTGTYGDVILNMPRKEGFNLLAWFAPFAALGLGAVGIGALLRTWRRNALQAAVARDAAATRRSAGSSAGTPAGADALEATPDELSRLAAALRDDSAG